MSVSFGGKLNQILGLDKIRPGGRAAFSAHCYRISAERAFIAVFALLAVNLALFIMVDFATWRAGHWVLEPAHIKVFEWRLSLLILLAALTLLRWLLRKALVRNQVFSGLCVITLPFMGVWFSIVFQDLAPDTSIFALFLLGTAVLLPMPSKSKLLIYPLALVLMLFGLHIASVDSVATLHTSINAACVCIAALVIEAVVMKSCASDFAQSEQLEFQARETTALLSKSLPATVIERLKESDETVVELHPEVSILFVDFAGFNKITESLEPEETIGLLDALFQEFDEAADRFGVEKIKASGDTYMAASGVPEYQANHAERVASLALRIRAIAQRFRADRGQPVLSASVSIVAQSLQVLLGANGIAMTSGARP